jgi:tetratricopeptide (TPR) repeat protein
VNTVEQTITRYEEAVNALEQASDAHLSAATLRVLIARDKVALSLADGDDVASPGSITLLSKTDQRVTKLAIRIDAVTGRKSLASWRRARNAAADAWWWKLDELADTQQPWAKRLWTLLAILFLTAAIGLGIDTFNLLRTVGSNPVSTIGTLIHAGLTFIAASAFTDAGRDWLINSFSQNRRFKGWSRALLALVVLSISFGLWLYLPGGAARYFRRQGNRFIAEGLTQSAIASYQQAIALEPHSIETHMALAGAEEKATDYSKAIEEYKNIIALAERIGPSALDDSYYLTRIKLARLLILQEKSYHKALAILESVEQRIDQVSGPNRKLYFYFVLTYSGWAELELGHDESARGDFNAAISQRENGAAAHYLLGRALEKLKDQKNALAEFSRFIRVLQEDPGQREDVPLEWIGDAQEKLTREALPQKSG